MSIQALTDETKEQLYNVREAFENMQLTYYEYVEAKRIILENTALQAEIITEPIQENP